MCCVCSRCLHLLGASEFLVSIGILCIWWCFLWYIEDIINSIYDCTICEELQLVWLMRVPVKYVAGANFAQDPSDVVMASR